MLISSRWNSLGPHGPNPAWCDLASAAQAVPGGVALIQADDRATTFSEFWTRSQGLAAYLQWEAAVAKGDTVAISADGSREFVVAMYAAFLLGARVATLNLQFGEDEAAEQLRDSCASVLFASESLCSIVPHLKADRRVPRLRQAIPLRDAWTLADWASHALELPAINPAVDHALLRYTSGTSGPPKGAILSHANLNASARQRAASGAMARNGVLLGLLPIWHTIRLTVALRRPCVDATGADPEQTLLLIHKHRVTDIQLRPYYLRTLLSVQEHRPRDLSTLRCIETSGTALSLDTARRATELFKCQVRQAYHSTETCASGNRMPRNEKGWDSVGYPVPDTEERIIDPVSGNDIPIGETGELLIRGPQVMLGYWQRPQETAEALSPERWLRTGDLARRDADGRVYIADRAKEMIKSYGRQVAPAEIEGVLLSHPAVEQVAVVAHPSVVAGETPKAFVVLRQGQSATPQELMGMVAARLAPFKWLEEVEFVSDLPRGSGGKILRRALTSKPSDGADSEL